MNFLIILRSIFRRSDIDISGNWTGIYGYGENYSKLVKEQTVKFTAQIERTWYNRFKGTIKESAEGIPEPAQISGSMQGKRIIFTKTYNSGYQIDKNGTVSKMPHGPMHIIYEGLYDPSERRIYGQWRIETIYLYKSGKKVEHISKGYWEMLKS
jgi:hypothetical protein